MHPLQGARGAETGVLSQLVGEFSPTSGIFIFKLDARRTLGVHGGHGAHAIALDALCHLSRVLLEALTCARHGAVSAAGDHE